MAEATEELRADIESRRERMSGTVDEIENRVSPSANAARGRDRLRRSLSNARNQVMGSDDGPDAAESGSATSLRDRATSRIQDANDPRDVAQRRTRGNPAAAGMISFGFGLLLGTILPASRTERDMARSAQPQLRQVAEHAASSGQEVAGEVQEKAKDAAKELKQSATQAADDVKSEGSDAARQVREQQRS